MKDLFKKLKQMTGCTNVALANSAYCTKQYINQLIHNRGMKNDMKLAVAMVNYLDDLIDRETGFYLKRMDALRELKKEIQQQADELCEEESA